MSGRGARDRPLTYHGEHDMALTYLPRQIVKVGTTAYLATAVSLGEDPATTPASWLPLGGGGDGEHNGTGLYSTAVGTDTTAAGDNSTAVGDNTEASGNQSTALGQSVFATERGATALGYATNATAEESTAVGFESIAEGYRAVAIGGLASGDQSIAVGVGAVASAAAAVAVGYTAEATGGESIAIGDTAHGYGNNSVAIGRNAHTLLDSYDGGGVAGSGVAVGQNTTAGAGALAVGAGATANHDYSMAFGNVTAPAVKQAAMKTDLLRLVPISLEARSGLALRSVDGEGGFTDWAIYVDNSGAISTVAL